MSNRGLIGALRAEVDYRERFSGNAGERTVMILCKNLIEVLEESEKQENLALAAAFKAPEECPEIIFTLTERGVESLNKLVSSAFAEKADHEPARRCGNQIFLKSRSSKAVLGILNYWKDEILSVQNLDPSWHINLGSFLANSDEDE